MLLETSNYFSAPWSNAWWVGGAIIVHGLEAYGVHFVGQAMKSQMGLLMNIILGIIGAAIGSAILTFFGVNLGGWIGYLIAGFIGAVLLIWIVRMVRGRA